MIKNYKHSAFILVILIFSCFQLKAQSNHGIQYNFSTGVSTVPSGATTVLSAQDDNTLSIPFTFKFAGVTYTNVIISTNGWLALAPNATIPATMVSGLSTGSLSSYSGGLPLIAPLWDNLYANSVGYTNGGTTLTVRWNVKWNNVNPTAQIGMFGVTLNQTTGVITFGYNLTAYNASAAPSVPGASIGIAGVCSGDYYYYKPATLNVDSTTADLHNITSKPATSIIFTPYQMGDNCSANPYPAFDLGTIGATCTPATYALGNNTGAGTSCAPTDVNDIWFKLIKPLGALGLTVTTSPAACGSIAGTSIELYSSCGGAAIAGSCATTGSSAGFGEVTISRPCAAETLWVRVTGDGNEGGKLQICAKTVTGSATGYTCATAIPICSLPYGPYNGNTLGSGNDYDSTSSACHTILMNGEDMVFSFTPSTDQCINIDLNSTGTNPSVFLYQGCPAGGVCQGSTDGSSTFSILGAPVKANVTYYIVVDNGVTNGSIPFTLNVTNAGTPPPYDDCNAPYSFGTITTAVNTCITLTTACATASVAGAVYPPSCIPANNPPFFVDGVTGDVWMTFSPATNLPLQISTSQGAVNPTANAAMEVYRVLGGPSCGGLSAASSLVACDYNSGPNGMPTLSIPVATGYTYYIRIWSETPENAGSINVCLLSACAPANDLPCNAAALPLGGTLLGSNNCADITGEPLNAGQCVAGGSINTVWYTVTVPASGSVRVRTHPLTLTNTQIQAYTVTNCLLSATFTSVGCNDNGVACSGGFSDFSEQLYSSLTPGSSLYIVVDGVGGLTGSFEITAIDGAGTVFPPVAQQDCASPQVICSTSSVVVADPGYRNNGNICDLPGAYSCWGVGERNSVWYQFTVDPGAGSANVYFDVLSNASADIDLLMWDVTSNVSGACANLTNGTFPNWCNYAAANASTGLAASTPYGYSVGPNISGSPHTYLLLLNVFNSYANAGFTLSWGSTPISTTPTNSVWSGFTDTKFNTTTNWGDCGSTPSCAKDATINFTSNLRQPIIDVPMGTQSVKNILINSGATLTILTGATLSVCGNFTNNGTLVCQPGSTIQFIGSGTQTITGSLTGTNSFANLLISKSTGSVVLASDIDVSGNFTTASGSSIFNINGKYMKLQGNFTNASGNTTFTGTAGSTFEFNGTSAQYFTNSISAMSLDKVKMNNTVSNLYLSATGLSTLNIDNELTLTSGKINTRALTGLEVNLKNPLPASLIAFGATSYIDGKFRRKISNGVSSPATPAVYNFPVGDSLISGIGGYENAAITFTTPTLIPNLLAYFSPFPSTPPNGPTTSECPNLNYALGPLLNNGYWTIERNDPTFYGGTYKVTLNNTGYTNANGSSNSFTVITSPNIANPPSNASSWTAYPNLGVCNAGSTTAANTYRDGFNNPASTAASFNHLYSTGQAIYVLPVKLLSFTAEPTGENVTCKWTTASETNNNYFEVEKSLDAKEFKSIGRVNGFGAGTSTELRNYSFVDQDRCTDLQYYRLKQVDIDGQFSYSDPVAVNCKNTSELEVYPNPATSTLIYKFLSDADAPVTTSVIDISGRVLLTEKIDAVKGYNIFTISLGDLSAGSYYLRVNDKSLQQILQAKFSKSDY